MSKYFLFVFVTKVLNNGRGQCRGRYRISDRGRYRISRFRMLRVLR